MSTVVLAVIAPQKAGLDADGRERTLRTWIVFQVPAGCRSFNETRQAG